MNINSDSIPKVFISYSRRDALPFVDQLLAGLKVGQFLPIIDRNDIVKGEDWQKRLGDLIAEADFVVFVISPDAVTSKFCEWEISQTTRLGKRLLPVIPEPMDMSPIPQSLQQLNFTFFYANPDFPGSGFGQGLLNLCIALRTDLDWVRAHTRYGQRASEWTTGGRVANRLLSGDDVEMAKEWIAKRESDAPEITDEMREFILASESAEIERRKADERRLQEREDTLAKMETVKEQALGYLELAGLAGNQMLKRMESVKLSPRQKRCMIELCHDATNTTRRIATSTSETEREETVEHFWYLYWGPLYIVETYQKSQGTESPIESNMVAFGETLNEIKTLKEKEASSEEVLAELRIELVTKADAVSAACHEFEAFLGE